MVKQKNWLNRKMVKWKKSVKYKKWLNGKIS